MSRCRKSSTSRRPSLPPAPGSLPLERLLFRNGYLSPPSPPSTDEVPKAATATVQTEAGTGLERERTPGPGESLLLKVTEMSFRRSYGRFYLHLLVRGSCDEASEWGQFSLELVLPVESESQLHRFFLVCRQASYLISERELFHQMVTFGST